VKLLRGADLILHAGDFVSVAFLEELRALGPPVEAVRGNMDEPALTAALPERHVVQVGSVRIGLVHDAGPRGRRETRLAARFPDCDAVVYGHSHIPQVERFQDLWVLNPGSPTDKRRQPVPTMLLIRVRASRITPELVKL
jgi:putative phosphoesterase